ncbi:hypothetical protein CI109_101231 [Kwoniella shandongensis]|uniref:Uncharacterized protein n=1 Tax=Kwoniella shandongensis TaxID=1734106 RepID=A0A5M6BW14_9TREE|nr:uncharacterized protein CI109_005450 [Kwoniella shandongensis]KAA5526172.1 hypothetical protein CI109_005450 [Kwoniella shandongensis]
MASTSAYQPLPTSASSSTYPPSPPPLGPSPTSNTPVSSFSIFSPFSYYTRYTASSPPGPDSEQGGGWTHRSQSHRKSRLTPLTFLKYTFGVTAGLIVFHYFIIGAFPSSSYTTSYRNRFHHGHVYGSVEDRIAILDALDDVNKLDTPLTGGGGGGTFFRDSYPIKSMITFLELAEKEVKARGLDTCYGQLGRELIEAYHEGQVDYCSKRNTNSSTTTTKGFVPLNTTHDSSGSSSSEDRRTHITCLPVHHSSFSNWWPYPASPCLSTNIIPVPGESTRNSGDSRGYKAVGCEITPEGRQLLDEMGGEKFLGSYLDVQNDDEGLSTERCKERLERTVVVIGRQDQWNPFHVAEDLITTMVTILIAARTAPALINTRVQLVFQEGFGMDANHFTPLWDRIGAWAPRRLSLDPWQEGVCLTNTIHSVGAGASLLSAMGVGNPYSCASTITWAASHYYRLLFGLPPPSLALTTSGNGTPVRQRRPINVLWLSRAKLDTFAKSHDDWSSWRDVRHIINEPDLINKLRTELASLCDEGNDSSSSVFGPAGCTFEDAQEIPETWALTNPFDDDGITPTPVRFAMIDPTVHTLETQIHFVGHTTILLSSHGGALGLSLFLPPGEGTIVELQVEDVWGNWHFQHMAKEMGHGYEMVEIDKWVDTEVVWQSLKKWVLEAAG